MVFNLLIMKIIICQDEEYNPPSSCPTSHCPVISVLRELSFNCTDIYHDKQVCRDRYGVFLCIGSFVLDTSSYYLNSSKTSFSTQTVTIPLITARNRSDYHSFFTFADLEYVITPTYWIDINLDRGTNTTSSMTVSLISSKSNYIKSLTIRHMVIDEVNFIKFKIYIGWLDLFGGTTTIDSGTPQIFNYPSDPMNMTQTPVVFALLCGFSLRAADSSKTFDLYIVAVMPDAATIRITVGTSSSMTIANVYFIFCQYAMEDAASWPFPAARTNYYDFSSGEGPPVYTDIIQKSQTYNTFWGLTYFSVSGRNSLEFDTAFVPLGSITVNSLNTYSSLVILAFGVISWEFKQCDSTTPFYMVATDVCYNPCPPRYYQDTTKMICGACYSYTCYTCNKTQSLTSCLTCNDTTDFRNLSSGNCVPFPGYYDDGTNNPIAQPCDPNCLTCNINSVTCLTCNPGNYLTSNNTCAPCGVANCNNCTSLTNCQVCITGYTLSASTCTFNCSSIANCASCTSSACDTCAIGYYLVVNTIPAALTVASVRPVSLVAAVSSSPCALNIPTCGNSIIEGTEQCDDGNLVSGDGCSDTCTVETDFACTSVTLAAKISGNSTCSLNCSMVTNCNLCNLTSCVTCNFAYTLISATSCQLIPACGNSIIESPEQCDDGNTVSGDGCSNTCTIETSFNCASVVLSGRITGNTTCLINCTLVSNCMQCNSSSCTNCSVGFTLSSSTSCIIKDPICGDGTITSTEQCDDGNTISNDGCSNSCLVQPNFSCNGTSGISVCSFTQFIIQQISLVKSPNQNQAVLTFSLFPALVPSFSTLNWSNIIIPPSNLDGTITSYVYDPQTGTLSANINYNSNIDSSNLNFTLNTKAGGPLFSLVSSLNSYQIMMNADNNEGLQYYTADDYALAKGVGYASTIIGVVGLVMMLMGLFGGKLIGLQGAAVIQITYLSMISLTKMSPTFSNLQYLSFSCGYHTLAPYNMAQSIDKPYKGVELDLSFLNNFNVMMVLVLTPPFIALLSKILSKTCLKHKQQKLDTIAFYSLKEYTLYGYLFNSYIIFTSFLIEIIFFSKIPDADRALGMIFGSAYIGAGILYFILFIVFPDNFGEFKDKFIKSGFGQKFYLMIMCERLLCTLILTSMLSLNFQNGILIAIFVSELIIIMVKKPYIGDRKNNRPICNMLITILIEVIFLVNNLIGEPQGIVAMYAPLLILALLLVVVVYSTILLVFDMKESLANFKKFILEDESEDKLYLQSQEFKLMQSSMFKAHEILKTSKLTTKFVKQPAEDYKDINEDTSKDQLMPEEQMNNKSFLASIKEKITKMKSFNDIEMTPQIFENNSFYPEEQLNNL